MWSNESRVSLPQTIQLINGSIHSSQTDHIAYPSDIDCFGKGDWPDL